MKKEHLETFEKTIAEYFEAKKIHCPIHLSGGNEAELIKIFQDIDKNDYVFASHRNHYQYLLHTGDFDGLTKQILIKNDSMHTCDPEHRFFSSSIVAGYVAIAAGVALALKMKKSKRKVWIFCGDGCVDESWFYEAWRYAVGQDLPITFIIENNNRSVCTSIKDRWGREDKFMDYIKTQPKIIYYEYKAKWPHCGIGKFVNF